jgi:hypothetical protein
MTKAERHQLFRDDMEKAGYEVQDYRGRNFYVGPPSFAPALKSKT